MSYRAKAKTIVQAVRREIDGAIPAGLRPIYSLRANWGTKVQKRLAYVEDAERTLDFGEFCRLKYALQRYGSVRAAVADGFYDR